MITFKEYLAFEAGDPNDQFTPAWYWKHIRRIFRMNYKFKESTPPYVYVVFDEDQEIGYIEKGEDWYHFIVYTHSFSHKIWKDEMNNQEIQKTFMIFNENVSKDADKMIHIWNEKPIESRKS